MVVHAMQWGIGTYLRGDFISYMSSIEVGCCVGFSGVCLQGDKGRWCAGLE